MKIGKNKKAHIRAGIERATNLWIRSRRRIDEGLGDSWDRAKIKAGLHRLTFEMVMGCLEEPIENHGDRMHDLIARIHKMDAEGK